MFNSNPLVRRSRDRVITLDGVDVNLTSIRRAVKSGYKLTEIHRQLSTHLSQDSCLELYRRARVSIQEDRKKLR